jgi:hypothetical protein
MPRTKKSQPARTTQPERQHAAVNGPPGEVLTLAEAATYLRLPEKDVIAAVETAGAHGQERGEELDLTFPPAALE